MHGSHYFLILIMLCCVAFIACDEAQLIMKPVVPSELSAAGIRIEIKPTEQGNPAHGFGTRSVYINGIGVAALKDDTLKTFPIGTLITKEVNNNTNTFVQHVAIMKKTDETEYAAHNGWLYTQHTRQTESEKFVAVGGDVPGSTSDSCHACHTQAPKDSVFTQLPTPDAAVEEVPLPSEPEPEPEPTEEQPQETEETQTSEETEDAPSEVDPDLGRGNNPVGN
ncbi:MAG: cytochrome P460 family protein [Candidatus Poribacteria bacterium]|nr:cytochrome P460 family protein [Candidatus Poribacteria bacterium]